MKSKSSGDNNRIESEAGSKNLEVNRRKFLKITGKGIFVFFTVGDLKAALQRSRRRDYPQDFNAYLRIAEDGRIACYTGKIEMGQGIITSLAQMLSEELDVSLDSIEMVMGDTKLCPYDGGTTGSRSTKNFGPPLRRAGAEARAILIKLAGEKWQVTPAQLIVKNGIIYAKGSQKQISYAALARGQRIERHLKDISIKPQSAHLISGMATSRTDAVSKVTGEAKFAGDIHLPGMLYAKILRPPAHNATLKSVNVTSAKGIQGLRIVNEDDLVAVLHENPNVAENALARIKAEFEEPKQTIQNHNVFEYLQNIDTEGEIEFEAGDLKKGLTISDQHIESLYYNHYVAHAPMEPHTILADVAEDEVRIWASSQTPFRVQSLVAETLGIPEEKVHVITPFLGGGFGGKKAGIDIIQATRLSKITQRPVQIAYTRKEEFFYDAFRPAAVIKMRSGINSSGNIVYWDYENFFAGSRSSEPIYNIPHYRVQSRRQVNRNNPIHPFNVGAWRGPGSNTNVFAMESQTDILAQTLDTDPLTFRLRNLTNKRMIRVLNAAIERFGKSFSKGPSGKGFGIACTNYLNTYVATIAEVEVDKKSGYVQVKHLVCSQDMGEIINPQGAKLQIEGGLTMGIGYALSEEILFEGGKILVENYDSYEITRFSQAPRIDVVLIDNKDLAPQGCGEPAITTMGAVIANAVFDACGARLYTLPMTPERIKSALEL